MLQWNATKTRLLTKHKSPSRLVMNLSALNFVTQNVLKSEESEMSEAGVDGYCLLRPPRSRNVIMINEPHLSWQCADEFCSGGKSPVARIWGVSTSITH